MTLSLRHITSRQVFSALALLLFIVLVALLVYLALFMPPDTAVTNSGEERSGIRPILTLYGPGTGANPKFSRPLGAALAPDGTIWVADTGNNRVCVFDAAGRFLFEFGGLGITKPASGIKATWKPGRMNFPTGIAVDEDGTVYVADFYNNQIQVFDAKGTFLRRFPDPYSRVGRGSSGDGGTGIAVTDVAVANGLVYATDRYQVVVFSSDGKFVRQFGRPGTAPGHMDHPNGITVDADGNIYVADSNNNRVMAFTADGVPQWVVGNPITELGRRVKNEVGFPRDVAITDGGTLVVIDAFEFEIVELDRKGNVLGRYGQRGVAPGQFNFPNSIDARENLLLVADKENDRVQLLELVRR